MQTFLPDEMTTIRFLLAQLLLAATLLLSCLAQDSNDTAWCPDVSPEFNSSGQTEFQLASNEEWYMSFAMKDWRSPFLVHQTQDIKAYISHPESTVVTRGCFYQFNGVNASASGTDGNGCDGVLSSECINVLREISFPSVPIGGSEEDLRCERSVISDRVRDACPGEMLSPGVMSSPLLDLSNQTCDDVSPPGESIPEQYHTRSMGTIGSGSRNSDRDASSFVWYDLSVTRPVPFVFAASLRDGSTETQVVCVAPNNVAEGSREPEEDEPWESAGARKSWVAAGHVAAVAAIAVVVVTF